MVLVKPVQVLTDMLLVNMKMKTTQKNTRTAKKKALQWWTWLLDRMKAYDGLTVGSPAHVQLCTRPLWCMSPLRTPSTVCLFTFLIKELLSPPSLPLPTLPFSSLSVPLWFILCCHCFLQKVLYSHSSSTFISTFPRKIAPHYYRCQLWRHIVATNQGHNF